MAETIQIGLVQETLLRGKVEAILIILRSRFGSVSDNIVSTLGRMTDSVALDSLIVHATNCTSPNDFADSL